MSLREYIDKKTEGARRALQGTIRELLNREPAGFIDQKRADELRAEMHLVMNKPLRGLVTVAIYDEPRDGDPEGYGMTLIVEGSNGVAKNLLRCIELEMKYADAVDAIRARDPAADVCRCANCTERRRRMAVANASEEDVFHMAVEQAIRELLGDDVVHIRL